MSTPNPDIFVQFEKQIADNLSPVLSPLGISHKVRIKDNCFHILVTSADNQDKEQIIPLIDKELIPFSFLAIPSAHVYFMINGEQTYLWDEPFVVGRYGWYRPPNAVNIPATGTTIQNPPLPEQTGGGESEDTPQPARLLPQHIGGDTWKVIGIGSIMGLVLTIVPFLHFIFSYFSTLVHELGHAMFAWLFGRLAIPAFDFMFGGGVTMIYDRAAGFEWFICIVFVIILFVSRHNILRIMWLSGFIAVYLILMFTHGDEWLGLFMGHGSELIFAGIFIYRGISSYACNSEAERYAYMMIGTFLSFHAIGFAHGLMFDPYKVSEYLDGKGGILDNDFVRIANDYWNTHLSAVVRVYYILALLTPVVTLLAYIYRYNWLSLLNRLMSVDEQESGRG